MIGLMMTARATTHSDTMSTSPEKKQKISKEEEDRLVNQIRILSASMPEAAKSGYVSGL